MSLAVPALLLLASHAAPAVTSPAGSRSSSSSEPTAWPLFSGTAPGDRPGFFTPETTEIWPAGRVIRNVTHPSVTPFLANASHPDNTGAAVVIAPGGAYKWLTWDAEGVDIAKWLNSIGVSAFVLKYRVPFRPWLMQPGFGHTFGTAPLIDAQRAMGMVRHRATALGLNSSRIGFIGFSAGGSVTAHIATNHTVRAYPAIDAADKLSCRPDFVMVRRRRRRCMRRTRSTHTPHPFTPGRPFVLPLRMAAACRMWTKQMVYPAYLVNGTSDQLMAENITATHPPAFLAQTEVRRPS